LRSGTMRLALALVLSVAGGAALLQPPILRQKERSVLLGRRDAALIGLGAAATLTNPGRAAASGGATAGKTTSIPRAKLRYYDRIIAVVAAYEGLAASIKAGDVNKKNKFFSDANESPLSELTTAGYLLAVAFKIDTKIPPDKIPAVKDFKLLMKDMDKLKGAFASGKATAAEAAYSKTSESFNVWLERVELPPLGDAQYKS